MRNQLQRESVVQGPNNYLLCTMYILLTQFPNKNVVFLHEEILFLTITYAKS